MADKKGKGPKKTNHPEKGDQKNPEIVSKKMNISDDFLKELTWAFSNFNEKSETQRIELYGNKEYLEQFREYFKIQHPNLLDKIDQKDLPVYIQAIEKKGFSIENITKNAGKLNEEFKDEDTELHVMEHSLSELRKFCDDKTNNVPDGIFKKFADLAWFTHDTLIISSDGALNKIDDLPVVWKKFLEKEGIVLGATSASHAERILTPNYNPTERVMVTVAINKIRNELKGSLKTSFNDRFPLTVTVHSAYQDLINFRDELKSFLDDHASEIDEALAKKIDRVIVTNGDIYKELMKSGRKFDDTKWFSEWEQYFRRIFNKLATRQLFEEVQKTEKTIDHYVTEIGNTFKEFPPYVNDILDIYKFNPVIINALDSSFESDWQDINNQIDELNHQYAAATDEQKNELRKKIKALKAQKEQRKWQAYILFLRTKDAALADVFAQLVASTFDFSVLLPGQQQLILDVLIKNKLEDSIKNKVPELLDVKEEALTQFIHDLFDLKKMDLAIPTSKHGIVSLTFLKKGFLASTRKQLPALSDLETDIKNLPLNFLTQLTESNSAFFEDSPIFDSIYTDFIANNGKFRLNDAYKVKIKKDGKVVEWYLSAYCPIDEFNTNREDRNGKELYLYSEPITAPNQERELRTRPTEDGKLKIPVVIKDTDQASCDMEILDKQLNLNGDAFGALLFGYVLGQQSMNTSMSPAKEEELAGKLGKLDTYKDKEEWEEEEIVPLVEAPEKSKEKSEKEKFDHQRKELKWYGFPEKEYEKNNGFVVWSRLFIPFADSEVPPVETGKAVLQMEITHIDQDKWTFKVKIHGGELRLGKSEWVTKELRMNVSSLTDITKAFGDKIYKMPDITHLSFEQQMEKITSWSFIAAEDIDKYFWLTKFDWSKFVYTMGEYKNKEITHFGVYEPKIMDEELDQESGKLILYKIKYNPNGTIHVSGDSMSRNFAKNFPSRDMDYTTFMLFVKEKWLQPKCKEQLEIIDKKAQANEEATPTTIRWFSFNNIISFFKNGVSKIQDGIKKYDDERTEDLTDLLTNKGQLWSSIGWFLSPFWRISSSFETMGAEAYFERDTRVWKKVEKREKVYEDYDYSKLYTEVIFPMLSWKVTIVPHYKIAAILLAHLKKGKWPYAKELPIADGLWIGKLLGTAHQERYLAMREKKIRDLEQNAHLYPIQWADNIKNELVELEMRYIVHVMDGRQMWIQGDNDKTKLHFQDKYSKKFCDELESTYTWFYKQSSVEEWFTKAQDANFEFARVEYFRLLPDRPQQALPYLKVMAMKAINDTQWQVFETAVLAWILSGVFINMTYSTTQSYIQKICRTRWFIPWIYARDIKQQHKIQRLLDLFSNGEFTEDTKYSPNEFSFRTNTSPKNFIKSFVKRSDKTKDWLSNRSKLSKFLELKGENINKKTLLDLHSDPETSVSDKLLLEEYIGKTNEKNEDLDTDVQKNTSSLTWSILTKSQSVVDQMIKFDAWGFAGKTWDEKEDMKRFSEKMQNAIPSQAIGSQEKVKFFLDKFFNRFGEKFSWTKKIELLKRLKYCQENKWKPEVDDVLYYSIVWEIVSVLAPNNSTPPDELSWALWAWQNFFKENIDTILQTDMISSCFGGPSYKDDYVTSKPKLKPRKDCISLLDRDLKQTAMLGLSPEQKRLINEDNKKLKSDKNWLNVPLYDIADKLYRNCGITNRFKNSVDTARPGSHIPKSSPPKATWANIRNPEVIESVRRILEGKAPEEEDPDEDAIMYDYDPYMDR